MDGVRVDKWLWSIRLFKSRTIATDACKAGKVKLAESYLKPSHDIKVGDLLIVFKEGFRLQIKVKDLLEKESAPPWRKTIMKILLLRTNSINTNPGSLVKEQQKSEIKA